MVSKNGIEHLYRVEIGRRLTEERKRNDLTLESCAQIGDISVSAQKVFESGISTPSAWYLYLLHLAGLDTGYILTGKTSEREIDHGGQTHEIIAAIEAWAQQHARTVSRELLATVFSILDKPDSSEKAGS